jgi:hypothetical protein
VYCRSAGVARRIQSATIIDFRGATQLLNSRRRQAAFPAGIGV